MCIECSGVHRQLGSHISRVRSLELDEWPPGHLAVMAAIGNRMANQVWECAGRATKPGPTSSPEEKERSVRKGRRSCHANQLTLHYLEFLEGKRDIPKFDFCRPKKTTLPWQFFS